MFQAVSKFLHTTVGAVKIKLKMGLNLREKNRVATSPAIRQYDWWHDFYSQTCSAEYNDYSV